MHKISKKNPNGSSPLGRFFSSFKGRKTSERSLVKAPRRRDIERLEERQMLSVNFADDPLFQDQWHLLATGQRVEQITSPSYEQSIATHDINILGAWDLGYTGSGVQVAVYDTGFDLNHPDLQFALISEDGSFLDVIDMDDDPAYIDTTDFSGTAVAGVIGALDNTEGGLGVAPGVDMIPVRFLLGDNDVATIEPLTEVESAGFEFVQFAGIPDEEGEDNRTSTTVVDVYFRGYTLTDDNRDAVALNTAQLNALEQAATLGRGTWQDVDGDGVFEDEEIVGLGVINIVPAGNEGNFSFIDVFDVDGIISSSQYDGLANSRYTIAVGVVDYDGDYYNTATGGRGSWGETGANVLLVAPSQTIGVNVGPTQIDGEDFIGGITTTDNSGNDGEDGANSAPVFGQQVDGDFQPDTNYSSTTGGAAEAAAQVAGVVALMLEANPSLSYRDVQQILLMSAEQVDIFDETWIVNAYAYFENTYDEYALYDGNQIYTYYEFDTNADGDADVTGAIPDYYEGEQYYTFDVDGNLVEITPSSGLLPTTFIDISDLIISGAIAFVGGGVISPTSPDGPINVYGANINTADNLGSGVTGLLFPVAGKDNYVSTKTTSTSGATLVNKDLQFSNGAGFTVSWGYGDYLEEYGYAHGSLDAELAVTLAEQWETYDLYLGDETLVSTGVLGASGASLAIQASAEVALPGGLGVLEIPGGFNTVAINTDYFTELYTPYEFTNLAVDGNDVGSVITNGPFYTPTGNVTPDNTWISGRLEIPIDTAISTDFLSVEWFEFTTELTSGDIDDLRVSIVSPDGTQSELSPFRQEDDILNETYQHPQLQQGGANPAFEILDDFIWGSGFIVNDDGTSAFIDGQEDVQVGGFAGDFDAPIDPGESWTWTSNRHWGELFSSEAHNNDIPGGTVDGQWTLVIENWADSTAGISSNYKIDIYGVEATGNRIQGKIGVDDNAQGREDQDNDQVFNFERNITFGQATLEKIDPIFGFPVSSQTVQLVLDDATDSVHYNNNYYETVDDTTGEVFRYAVVDEYIYTALAEVLRGGTDFDAYVTGSLEDAGGTAAGDFVNTYTLYSGSEVSEWYNVYGATLGLDPNPVDNVYDNPNDTEDPNNGFFMVDPSTGDSIIGEADLAFWQDQLMTMIMADIATAEAFEPQLNYGIGATAEIDVLTPDIDTVGNVFTYQNFDYNQETFASNVVVQATQYIVNFDSAGNALPRVASGVVDYFVTGADGNYWFDVEANQAAPDPDDFVTTDAFDAAYAQWFSDFGKVYEYEISLAGDAAFQSRIIDADYSSQVDFLRDETGINAASIDYGDGSIDYQAGALKYNVPIFASPDVNNGQVTVLNDVNFLLVVDPAKTNVNVTGSVYRDQDGDNIFDSSETGAAGSVVYHDANGNGIFEETESSGTVDASGNYAFTVTGITSQQSITLAVDASSIPVNLEFLNPLTGSQSINVTPGFGVDLDFTLQLLGGEPALVQGIVYEDINQNATFDNTEFGLGLANQVTVYIDLNNDGVYDVGTEPSSTTLSDGTFAIESDIAGNYNVRVDLSSSPLTISTPINNAINVDVVVGEAISDLQFGMFDSRTQDFGDLLGYPTLLSQNGARHVVMPGVRLGSRIDIDDDGMPTADALGDNLSNINDEDGVVILGDIAANSDFDLEVIAFGEGLSLNAWIDFNNDGDWDDLGEQIFVDAGLTLGTKNTLTVTAPADVDPTATALAARFRWGPTSLSYDGAAASGEVEDYLLPTSTPVNISGIVRNDSDGDGIYDLSDMPVEDVVVYYDVNSDGIRQATEISSVTNANGEYQIAISTAASLAVTLRIDETSLLNNEEFISPIDGIFSQVVNPGVAETANFLVGFPQGIQGNVFADNDNNGLKGGTETGFAGITVNLFADSNNDGSYETFVASTVTDAAGDYTLPVAVADDYQIRLDFADLEFHSQTTPAGGQVVTIAPGVVGTAADFGIYNAALDFTADYGDLFGANFPTLESDSGASHTVVTGYFLGSGVDADPGTLTSTNATADDNSLTDDEDGIVLVSNQILANSDFEIDVTPTGIGGLMNAWIDFNNDGDWDDLGEQVLIDRAFASGQTTRVVIDTTGIDVSATASSLAARFRWGSAGLGYGGADTLGEVEDYLLPTSSINPNNVTGDYDGNGLVEANDHAVWVANYGSTTNFDADGNGDGKVDAADYTVWRDALAAASSAAASASASSDDSSQGEMLFVSPATYVAAATSQVVMEEADVEIPQLVQYPIEEEFAIVETVEVIASASQSLTLEAAVLIDSSQDESFAVGAEEDSEVTLAEETFDAALLSLDHLAFATDSEQDSEFALVDEEEEEDESLDEVLSEAFATI